jgi:hypothetical protein
VAVDPAAENLLPAPAEFDNVEFIGFGAPVSHEYDQIRFVGFPMPAAKE